MYVQEELSFQWKVAPVVSNKMKCFFNKTIITRSKVTKRSHTSLISISMKERATESLCHCVTVLLSY